MTHIEVVREPVSLGRLREIAGELGCQQAHLWGINLYPAQYPDDEWVEFDSMINLRPSRGNRSRSVEDPVLRRLVHSVVDALVDDG